MGDQAYIQVEVNDSKFHRNGYHDNLFGYGGGAHFMFDAELVLLIAATP